MRTLLVAAAAAIIVFGESAAATHWCESLNPELGLPSAYAGDKVVVPVTFVNAINETIELTVFLRFGWESQVLPWGNLVIDPGASKTVTSSKVVTATPGDYAVTIAVQGSVQSGGSAPPAETNRSVCPAVTHRLQVESLPLPPAVIAWASPNSGMAPLAANFSASVSGGLAPFQFNWSFGDGQTAADRVAIHVYLAPGEFVAQVMVVDSRGRQEVDRIPIVVMVGPDEPVLPLAGWLRLSPETYGIILGTSVTTVLFLAIAFLFSAASLRRIRATISRAPDGPASERRPLSAIGETSVLGSVPAGPVRLFGTVAASASVKEAEVEKGPSRQGDAIAGEVSLSDRFDWLERS